MYSLSEKITIALSTLLFASFTVLNKTSFSAIGVLIIALLMMFFHCQHSGWRLPRNLYSFQISMLLFAVFCLLSMAWSHNAKDALDKGVTVIEICACMTFVYWCHRDFNTMEPTILSVVWGGYIIAVYYFFVYGGVDLAMQNAAEGIREGVEFANINAIGRIMAIVIVLNVYMLMHSNKKRLYFGIPLPIMVLISTMSRTPLIEAIFGLVLLAFLNGIRKKKVLNVIFVLVFSALAFYLLYIAIKDIPILKGITNRMSSLTNLFSGSGSVDSSAVMRQKMIQVGLKLFKENPIIGVGISNAHYYADVLISKNTYLHNNYAELLATGGIIGTYLYYRIHVTLLIKLRKSYKTTDDPCMLCVVVILMLLLADYGCVSYYYKEIYYYFTLCYICLDKSYRNEEQVVPLEEI